MAEVKEKKESKFLNPFDSGVSYADFLASIPKGKSIEEHCKGILTQEEIEFLNTEIELIKNNK